jgi:hypothetical protein
MGQIIIRMVWFLLIAGSAAALRRSSRRCFLMVVTKLISESELEMCLVQQVGVDSTVGIATWCGLDGPGIESQWEARYSAPLQVGPGPHPVLLYSGYRVSFPGVN